MPLCTFLSLLLRLMRRKWRHHHGRLLLVAVVLARGPVFGGAGRGQRLRALLVRVLVVIGEARPGLIACAANCDRERTSRGKEKTTSKSTSTRRRIAKGSVDRKGGQERHTPPYER